MTRHSLEQWMRLVLAGTAFVVALLLTPRALLDAAGQADSREVPVDMLDPSGQDECLWCSSLPEDFDDLDDADCEDLDQREALQSMPDDVDPEELPSECRDEIPALEPSA